MYSLNVISNIETLTEHVNLSFDHNYIKSRYEWRKKYCYYLLIYCYRSVYYFLRCYLGLIQTIRHVHSIGSS